MSEGVSALVLFSGGQDSTTCLAWALDRYETVETVGFDYGQRHVIELECRGRVRDSIVRDMPKLGKRLGDDHLIDLGFLGQLSNTALTRDAPIQLDASGLPNTFVPGRNLLFLVVAAALAYRRGCKHIVGGMCETDYSGYPDCRDDAVKAMQAALNIGMDSRFVLETPLMWIDKAGTWELAESLAGLPMVSLIREHTHTCYLGNRGESHDWGFGCGDCPACQLRRDGYLQYIESRH